MVQDNEYINAEEDLEESQIMVDPDFFLLEWNQGYMSCICVFQRYIILEVTSTPEKEPHGSTTGGKQ